LAREVVRRNPDLIFAKSTELTLDFKAATTTIPIVGAFDSPVENSVVASLAHPGGNVTGASVGDELANVENLKLIIELAEKNRLPAI
jgi:putative ABC transport system substrate-binding protein